MPTAKRRVASKRAFKPVQKRGKEFVVVAKSTGKVLGHFKTKKAAEKQVQAIAISKIARGESVGR